MKPSQWAAHFALACTALGIPWLVDYQIAAYRGATPVNALAFSAGLFIMAFAFYAVGGRVTQAGELTAIQISVCFALAGIMVAGLWDFITQWDMGAVAALRSAVRAACLWVGLGGYMGGVWGILLSRRELAVNR